MKILIVEDCADDRRLLKYTIERNGHQVLEAVDGRQALELLVQQRPDLIISDALMPVMDGFELLRRIKMDDRFYTIPFIFYSAVYTEEKEVHLALSLGADDFVVKPLEPDVLWGRVTEILDSSRINKQKRPGNLCSEDEIYLQEYSRVVADKLEKKVRELEKAQVVIANSETRYRNFFNSVRDVFIVSDPECRITDANQATVEMFNLPLEELKGRFCYELFRGTSEPCSGCPIMMAAHEAQNYTTEIEHLNLKKIFRVSVSPLFDERGEVKSVIHFAKDITSQKKLEEQFRQSQKMEAIGTLAGGIAHDFNNILTGIIGYAEMVEDVIPADHPGQGYLEQVLKSADRATQLIRQILTFSRRGTQEKRPLHLQTVLKEALKLLRASLPSSIAIEEDIADNCGLVVADATQMHQVIMNLVTNARQAMATTDKGLLRVSLQPLIIKPEDRALFPDLGAGKYLKLEISDSGTGIDKETITKIFDPYFTTKEKGKGTGLGLAVVHGIVNDHGGLISVYSEPGQGTTFKIILPTQPEIELQAGEPQKTELPRGRERVLVVDDEKVIARVEQRLLEQLGYQVTAFSCSDEAFKAFQKQPEAFDLVLTDMTMPGMNGVELARKILNIRADMAIIIATGFSPLITPQGALHMGVRGYLKKPFQKQELAEIVRKVLDESALT